MFNWFAVGMLPHRVSILGLGLIGGSLLHRLAALGVEVTGYDADPATREAAVGSGFQASRSTHVEEAVEQADIVVLAVPLPAVKTVLTQMSDYTGLLTDVTSVKAEPRRLAAQHCPGARWVGGHPMAGREQSGFAAADPTLFDGCAWVLTLEEDTDLDGWLALASLVTAIGARAVPATADEHDAAVARISHVPHVLAAALAERAGEDPLALALGAGSFRDSTRVAATRPELTAAMCGGNADAVGSEIDALIARLTEARQRLDDPEWFRPGYEIRRAWPPPPGEPHELPATREALLALGRAGGWVTAADPAGATVWATSSRV
jgi:prephenate dehydrogenase